MATTNEDNTGLYFIVGGLLVAVVAFGLYYFGAVGDRGDMDTKTASVTESVAPAAGGPDIDVNINKDKKD